MKKGREYLNEREIYYIKKYSSLISENGYNLTTGGEGCAKPAKTFEERCACSKVLTEQEIRDIQDMLYNYYSYPEILEKYPKLSDSFLTNINTGLNFKRDDINYPIAAYHSSFSKEQQDKIFSEIIDGVPYSEIQKKYNISPALLSQINNGTQWHRRELKYPLSIRVKSTDWVNECFKDIIFEEYTYKQLAKKYGISEHTVKALGQGVHHHKDEFKYPLKANKIENQKIYKELF